MMKKLLMPNRKTFLTVIAFVLFCDHAFTQIKTAVNSSDTVILAPGAKLILVDSSFSFTEGPATDKQGNIFFTDQPNDKIWEYDITGKLSVFMDKTGRANGLYFDAKGNIISRSDEHDQL